MTAPRSVLLLVGISLYCVLLYGLTNQFPTRTPALLPTFPIEERIPVVAGSVWIYLSYFTLLIWTAVRLPREPWARRGTGALVFVITCCGIIFLVYPTTIVRLPIPDAGMSAAALRWVRRLDPPNNCFPSMHVALAATSALIQRKANPRRGALFLLWAALITASTLMTKQHYLLDVGGGLLLAASAWALFFVLPIRRPRDPRRG